ncbi:MAG: glycosyltransferase, partial [Longimicrobiales bacterium]|nr:glycosyltransferase [Longimicrobiales bacterium]
MTTLVPFLLALPWLGLVFFEAFVARFPSELPDAEPADGGDRRRSGSGAQDEIGADSATGTLDDGGHAVGAREWPFVSVVVPARNESANIAACLRSITASDYPDFEVVVVDDRSEDDTG